MPDKNNWPPAFGIFGSGLGMVVVVYPFVQIVGNAGIEAIVTTLQDVHGPAHEPIVQRLVVNPVNAFMRLTTLS